MSGDIERGLVSVVVPAFNAGRYLAECIDSVLSQDLPALELIVVDDGSTDDTRFLVEKYEAGVIYVWQRNSGGCSVPRNHGARLARGEFLAFFDADDVMCPGKLKAQLDVLQSDPELGLVLTDYRNFDESGDWARSHFSTCTNLLQQTGLQENGRALRLLPVVSNSLLVRENFGIAGSPLFRRSAFEQAGGFDESLRASEDFDLIYRVARRQPIALVGTVGFRRRLHKANMSNQTLRIIEYKVQSRRKLLAMEGPGELRGALRSAIAGFELARARALTDAGVGGSGTAYLSALRMDPIASLKQWRVLARALPLASKCQSSGGCGL